MNDVQPGEMSLWMIAGQPAMAAHAVECGVDRIMVDLEVHGKAERQAGRGAWLSPHRLSDVAPVRRAIGEAELLLRTNPLAPETRETVREEIAAGLGEGADRLMPPMIRSADEARAYRDLVAARAPITPLIETPEALSEIGEIARIEGVDEIYIGLNDLHLALGRSFMFEPVADGLLDEPAAELRALGTPFGFGGVARLGVGHVGAEQVLGEHARLGSSAVILARSFRDGVDDVEELKKRVDMAAEIRALRAACAQRRAAGPEALEENRRAFQAAVREVAERLAAGAR